MFNFWTVSPTYYNVYLLQVIRYITFGELQSIYVVLLGTTKSNIPLLDVFTTLSLKTKVDLSFWFTFINRFTWPVSTQFLSYAISMWGRSSSRTKNFWISLFSLQLFGLRLSSVIFFFYCLYLYINWNNYHRATS